MEYEILYNESPEGLSEDVNGCVDDGGWHPIGGIAILHRNWTNEHKGYDEEETIFYQAIIKEDNQPLDE